MVSFFNVPTVKIVRSQPGNVHYSVTVPQFKNLRFHLSVDRLRGKSNIKLPSAKASHRFEAYYYQKSMPDDKVIWIFGWGEELSDEQAESMLALIKDITINCLQKEKWSLKLLGNLRGKLV